MNNKQRTDYLKKLINTNWKAAVRALFRIYENQTESEKLTRSVIKHNGIGFASIDAKFLTGLVRHWEAKGFFTENQKATLMKIMPKYAGQLLKTKCDLEKLDRMIKRDEVAVM